MTNPFSWDYLTAPVGETAVWGPFSIAYLLFFAVGMLITIFFAYDAPQRLSDRPLLRRTIQRGTWIAFPIFGLGLLFFLFRVLEISALGLHMRIWLYIFALAALAMIVYFWYYIRAIYPRHVAAEQIEEQKRAYIERPAHGKPGRGRKKGKKKKRAS